MQRAQRRRMTARQKRHVDAVLLIAAPVAWASGLVLFLDFHIGGGCFRTEALGLSRLAWQNIHRVGALTMLTALGIHATTKARLGFRRCVRIFQGRPARHDMHELMLYATSTTVLVTGFVAWLVVAGSPPLWGPTPVGPIPGHRHPWIDVHNLTALVALILSINHIRRRWRALGHVL